METVYEWNYIDYVWNSYEKEQAVSRGKYNSSKIIPFDVDKSVGVLIILLFWNNYINIQKITT